LEKNKGLTPEFRELERQRSIARHNEAAAKDAAIASQAAENERLRAQIAELQAKAGG